jgi:hypothetical protein
MHLNSLFGEEVNMKRIFVVFSALVLIMVLAVVLAPAQTKKEEFKYEDKIGVIKIKKGEPIHIACWMPPWAQIQSEARRSRLKTRVENSSAIRSS